MNTAARFIRDKYSNYVNYYQCPNPGNITGTLNHMVYSEVEQRLILKCKQNS